MTPLDWNRARAFVVTAEAGSLTAAARRLGLTQPTLSRQIAALETELGVALFERVGKRLVLTATGAALVEHGRAMGEAAAALAVAASGSSLAIAGRVSISAADTYAAHVLPAVVARIRQAAPQIKVVVISSNTLSDLRRREADIAIRHVRPTEDGLIGRLIGESTAHLYASRDWIARKGWPASVQDIAAEDLIAYEDTDQFADLMGGIGLQVRPDDFRLVSENSVVVWEMVKQGLGICVMSREIARGTPDIVDLFPDAPPVRFPVWLVTHRELRTSRRIRLVYDLLAEALTELIGGGEARRPEV